MGTHWSHLLEEGGMVVVGGGGKQYGVIGGGGTPTHRSRDFGESLVSPSEGLGPLLSFSFELKSEYNTYMSTLYNLS